MQIGEDEEKVYLSGVFLDLETNFRVERPFTVSKLFRHRDGRVEALREQRLVQAIQAGASKSIRNAILAGLPRGFVETFYRRARAIAEREAKTTWSKLLEAYREFGVSKEMIEAHLGHPIEKISKEEIVDLRGIFNSLKDGVATAAEVFRRTETKGNDETGTVDDVLGGGAEVTGGTEKSEPAEDALAPPERKTEEAASENEAPESESPSETPTSSTESIDRGKPEGPPNEEVSKGGEVRSKEPEQGSLSEKSGEDWF
jgi:hypothetical protein